MLGQKLVPDRADLIDYNYAVAGHSGTLCDRDGELFIKPCTQAEIDFYQSANETHPEFADLMPLFMGSLLLNDATDVTSIKEQLPVVVDHIPKDVQEQVSHLVSHAHQAPSLQSRSSGTPDPVKKDNVTWVPNGTGKIKTDTAVVLDNAAFGYRRPNILDVKLGIRLWADDAPLEKRRRFDQVSAETTHRDLGFRIAGMRVYRGAHNAAELDDEQYKIYNKDYGRLDVQSDNIVSAFRRFVFNSAAGIDEDLGRAIATAFKADLERVRDILEREESRMYSSSLLFVFEGDGEALRAAVEEGNAAADRREQRRQERIRLQVESDETIECAVKAALAEKMALGRSNIRVDSGIDLGEDGEITIPTGPDGEASDEGILLISEGDSSLGEDEDEEEDMSSLPHIYTLKLIDFAHAQWTPGLGPDENCLTGVRSLIRIFDELSK